MMVLDQFEKRQLSNHTKSFNAGDTVKVHTRIREGEKERIQVFEGVIIKKKGSQNRETFTVRKMSYGVGVERVFPLHSPMIEKIELKQRGKVRRAKLYYLRDRSGRSARITEKREWEVSREKAIEEAYSETATLAAGEVEATKTEK